jgi:hypothetical protein
MPFLIGRFWRKEAIRQIEHGGRVGDHAGVCGNSRNNPRAVCLRRCLCVQVVAEIDVGVRMAQSVDRRAIGIARYLRTWRTSHETHRCAAVRSPLHQQLRLDVRAPRNAELV